MTAPRGEALGQHAHDVEIFVALESAHTDRRAARASNSASSGHSCAATSATICCASTSSGFCGNVTGGRARRAARHRAAPCIRRARRATAGRAAPWARRRPGGSRDRRAAGTSAIERGEPSWQTRSTSPMSMPSSSEAVATSTFSSPLLQALLGLEAQLLRHAAVVRHDVRGAEQLGEVPRRALGHAPRVDEDERGAMLAAPAARAARRPPVHTSVDMTASTAATTGTSIARSRGRT